MKYDQWLHMFSAIARILNRIIKCWQTFNKYAGKNWEYVC